MNLNQNFSSFFQKIRMDKGTTDKVDYRRHQIMSTINDCYRGYSNPVHYFYAGSYGRNTAIFTSDIDLICILPPSVYSRFDRYTYNGQSALLQEVKNVLSDRYPRTEMSGDGQVVCVDFSDGISFEIVPSFRLENGMYCYPDTHY